MVSVRRSRRHSALLHSSVLLRSASLDYAKLRGLRTLRMTDRSFILCISLLIFTAKHPRAVIIEKDRKRSGSVATLRNPKGDHISTWSDLATHHVCTKFSIKFSLAVIAEKDCKQSGSVATLRSPKGDHVLNMVGSRGALCSHKPAPFCGVRALGTVHLLEKSYW